MAGRQRRRIIQWFDDVSVSLYLRRTKLQFVSSSQTFAGIELSIPFTPKRDMSPSKFVQITGPQQWAYSVQTVIRSLSNPLNLNRGVASNVSVLNRTFNLNRSSLRYFKDNMQKIRAAAAT